MSRHDRWVGAGRRALWTAIAAAALLAAAAERSQAQLPACIGDCNGNRIVTVDELVRGVGIALGNQAASTCVPFDRNSNAVVSIDELVAGVNAALQGCFPPVFFRGVCLRPGPTGLVPCSAGSGLRLFVCADRSRCLVDPTARRLLQSGVVAADGSFSLLTGDEAILNGLLVLEADVISGFVYRGLTFGPSVPGANVTGLGVDPRSEAVVRILHENGLELFSDLSISDLIRIISMALANLDFSGRSPQDAAELAAGAARDDDAIREAIDSRKPTVAPTATVTQTATATVTATVTATPTTALSATPSQTASITSTASLTPSPSATPADTVSPTITSTRSATPTVTPTPTVTSTASVTPTVTPSNSPTATLPPLNLAIEVNPDPVRPGETVEVAFTITNTGGSNLSNVDLSMVLPANIEPFSDGLATGGARCGPNQSNMCDPGDTIAWTFLGFIAPGEGVTLRVPPIVAAGTPNGTALLFSGTAANTSLSATASYTAVVQSGAAAPYDVALTQNAEPIGPGEQLTYTVVYGFRAVVGQADTTLSLDLPDGVTLVDASDGGTPNEHGEITWAIGTLTPGDGGVRRVTVAVDDSVPRGTLLEAQAIIRRADGSGAKRANAVNRVATPPALRLAIEANPDPARVGDAVEVLVTVLNSGASAVDTSLHFIVPDQVDTFLDRRTFGGGICGAFSLGNDCSRRERVLFPLTVPPRDGISIRLDPIVAAAAINGSLINLQARLVNAQSSGVVAARTSVRVDSGTIWDLTLDDDRDPVGAGDVYTYQIVARLRPSDPAAADGEIELVLPDAVTLLAAGDDAEVDGGIVRWPLGAVASGDIVRRTVTVQVPNDATPATMLAAEAVVRDSQNALASRRVRTLTRVAQGSPLRLALVAHPDAVRPGEALETEIVVSNVSAANVNGISIEARIPPIADTFPAALSAGIQCTTQCAPTDTASWRVSSIPAGASVSVRMPPIITASTADGTLARLHVRAAADAGGGPTGRNAALSRSVEVDDDPPFDLAVTASSHFVIGGEMYTYTLHYGRTAGSGAGAARLRFELPPGVFLVEASDGGEAVGETAVEWDLGALAAGAGGARSVDVVVDALTAGTLLPARATLVDPGDPTSEQRADVVTTFGSSPIEIAMTAMPDPVAPGQAATVTMSITNNGAAAVTNVVANGIVPQEVNAFQDTATTGGGRCGAFASNSCGPRALVIFPIDRINPGETVVLTMPPTIRADVAPGNVVRFVGWVRRDTSSPPLLASTALTVIAP